MITRKIKSNEYKRVQEIEAHAFHEAFEDGNLTAEQIYAQLAEEQMDREDMNWDSRWAVFDDNGTMISTLIAIPYQAQFDGRIVPMTGIGGVATLPPYRRSGVTRFCIEAVLNSLYKDNIMLSYLHPFSSAFYRKFGYAPACEKNCYTINLDAIPNFNIAGTYHLLESETNFQSDIESIYKTWFNKYNLMTNDEDIEYIWTRKASPFVNNVYSYLYRNSDGVPLAYLTYFAKNKGLICTRFCFTGLEGLAALLDLLKKESARFETVKFSLPTDIDIISVIPEWRFEKIVCCREQNGMVRVINAERVLSLSKMQGTGSLKIEITDEIVPQNNGCFKVTFVDGITTEVKKCSEKADIKLTIDDFSSLICGRYNAEAIAYLPNVQVFCNQEKINKIFYKKPLYISREF